MGYVEYERRTSLNAPALVCAFRGWNDGGEAATTAATYLRDRWEAERFARLDPEDFFDFQVARPRVRLTDGVTRAVEWPANDFFAARPAGRDIVLFLGVEPNNRWRTFIQAVLDTAKELGVETFVTLGAFLADLPHTLETPITGSASNTEAATRLGIAASRYEGPTGIVGVLHDSARRAGFEAVSLWAGVPHYLPAGPNPKAALALLQKVGQLLGVEIETDTLARAADKWQEQLSEAISENDELRGYVEQLEENVGEGIDLGRIPTGDELAEELQRFLRNQRGEL
ncbi:MAG: PAC2 family protein [Actinomycetota bacterium]